MSISKFNTKKFYLTVGSMLAFTLLTYQGHLTPEWYVIGMLGAIAGHHLEDLIKAYKGTSDASPAQVNPS